MPYIHWLRIHLNYPCLECFRYVFISKTFRPSSSDGERNEEVENTPKYNKNQIDQQIVYGLQWIFLCFTFSPFLQLHSLFLSLAVLKSNLHEIECRTVFQKQHHPQIE